MSIRKFSIIPLLACALGVCVDAAPIVQVTGPVDFPGLASSPNQFGSYTYMFASWTQTIAYDNVSISMSGNGVSSPASGTVYLTTSSGPGTTVADEISRRTISVPVGPSSTIALFSGLRLLPATYYVMLFADQGSEIAWSATNSPTTTLGPGVSLTNLLVGGIAVVSPPFAPYAPATPTVLGFQNNVLLDVTSIPEPSTSSMLVLAALTLLARVLWRVTQNPKTRQWES